MDLTSDQTYRASSTPVQTTDQTCRLLRQRRPDRPHLFSRAYMYQHPNLLLNFSKQKYRCGRYGQYGQPRSGAGSECPDLSLTVGTVGTGGMFHANHREGDRAGGAGGRGQADGSSQASDSTGSWTRKFSLVTMDFQGGCSGF